VRYVSPARRAFLSFPLAVSAWLALAGVGAVAALAPAAGCNGTGTTPMCDFPDGANDPDAGCGVLIEASTDGVATEDVVEDVTTFPDATPDAATAQDAADAQVTSGADASDAHVTDAATGAHPG
jgi:hypothetical protein